MRKNWRQASKNVFGFKCLGSEIQADGDSWQAVAAVVRGKFDAGLDAFLVLTEGSSLDLW